MTTRRLLVGRTVDGKWHVLSHAGTRPRWDPVTGFRLGIGNLVPFIKSFWLDDMPVLFPDLNLQPGGGPVYVQLSASVEAEVLARAERKP